MLFPMMNLMSFPAATIDDIRFADCTFRGVETAEMLQYTGSVSFKNVTIEPLKKGRSLNSPGTPPVTPP